MQEKVTVLHTSRHANNSIGFATGVVDQPTSDDSEIHTTLIDLIVADFNTRLQEAFEDFSCEVSYVKGPVKIHDTQDLYHFEHDTMASAVGSTPSYRKPLPG